MPDRAARSGLSTDTLGRLLTDETLTSVDDERIVAAGDSAAPSDMPFRMSCQAAGPLGAHAADTVLSRIASKRPAPIDLGFAGQCTSLGRRMGVAHQADSGEHPAMIHSATFITNSLIEDFCTRDEAATRPTTSRVRSAERRGSHRVVSQA
ncbi:UNVERIFIED_CONTAM: NADH dehydrogenase FAD-containing subunit [Streptomyces canus]